MVSSRSHVVIQKIKERKRQKGQKKLSRALMPCAIGTSVEAHVCFLVYSTDDVVRGVSDSATMTAATTTHDSGGQEPRTMTATTTVKAAVGRRSRR